jgi:hypothetical protein
LHQADIERQQQQAKRGFIMLRFTIIQTSGESTNRQRLKEYTIRKLSYWCASKSAPIELYSPPTQRKRLAPAVMGSILVALLYGLIALAIFESWSR